MQSNNGQSDSVNNNSNSSGNQGNGPCVTADIHTSLTEPGYFCMLLQSVLVELGNDVKPLYPMRHYNDPAIGDYYLTQVHIRGRLEGY